MIRGDRVTVAGRPGRAYRVMGQATYLDDEGREVEHDWLLIRAMGTREVEAVAPGELTLIPVAADGTWRVA